MLRSVMLWLEVSPHIRLEMFTLHIQDYIQRKIIFWTRCPLLLFVTDKPRWLQGKTRMTSSAAYAKGQISMWLAPVIKVHFVYK